MKISIITCHFVHNYGAVLQAYALSHKIGQIAPDTDVKIIDYRPEYLAASHRVFHVGAEKYRRNIILKMMYIVRTFPFRYTSYRNFNRFVKTELNLTDRRYTTYEELCENPPESDICVCGSDQIWNYRIDNGKDPSFYLRFAENAKKVAYAPSFGVSDISDDECEMIRPMIKDFGALSVREDTGAEILERIGYHGVPVVTDPVFLLDSKEWDELAKPLNIGCRYVFIYKITRNTALYDFARKIAEKIGAKTIEVGFSAKCDGVVDKYLCGVSPNEFLTYIKNAEYVVTDSFHGTSFSIIYGKPFTVFDRGELNSRITSLLTLTGLSDRFYSPDRSAEDCYDSKIDFASAKAKLNENVSKSTDYLKECIRL